MKRRSAFIILIMLISFACFADTIVLKTGEKLEVYDIREEGDFVYCSTDKTDYVLNIDDISSIVSGGVKDAAGASENKLIDDRPGSGLSGMMIIGAVALVVVVMAVILITMFRNKEKSVPAADRGLYTDKPDDGKIQPYERSRYGCVTVWLILLLLVNSLSAVASLGMMIFKNVITITVMPFSVLSGWALFLMFVCFTLNTVCVVAILSWKKWGFYGYSFTCAASVLFDMALGLDFLNTIQAIASVIVLYVLLNIGGKNRAWTMLE